ncbi:MAG: OmpA family protein [Alphaproteobacteria bacterium]|nr:OmpA family protein [Alphaproteobacteria bacterium]
MRYGYLGASAALALALSWGQAQAQAWYFGGEGGWTDLENERGTITTTSASAGFGAAGNRFAVRERWNDGFNVGARAGYMWGPWRFEEEYQYSQNGIRRAFIGGAAIGGANGDRDTHALMTNAIYDFTFGWPITPHLGGGIGAINLREGLGGTAGGRTGEIQNGSQWEFGLQGIAGIRYNINPALAFDLDYRYLTTIDQTRFRNNGSVPAPFSRSRFTSGYDTHNIVASLSLLFGAPPPPPPPVVAQPQPPMVPPPGRRVFLVFFDWDRDTITPEGMQIIQQAADAFRAGGAVQIQVTGYTDRSGSPGYNQRLSERRANNVANAMVRLGVPRNQMAVSGRGENDNRVPTAPGVREPQNRRVEIVFP